MSTTEALITERRDNLREGTPGNVRATVDHLLDCAWEALYERKERDSDGIITASAHVDVALELLIAYRARLAALEERDSDEHPEGVAKQQTSPTPALRARWEFPR